MTLVAGETRRKGWYHGWNIVAVAILSQVAANGLALNAFSLFLRDWSTELHTPISTLQLALASLIVVSSLLSPLVGTLADTKPARWIFGSGLVALVLFHYCMSAATQTWQLVALYAGLLPIAVVLSTAVPSNTVVSRWFVRSRGLALGLTSFGIGMAGVIIPPIIAALMPTLGWRAIWRWASVLIALVVLPLVLWGLRDRPTERDGLHYLTDDGNAKPFHAHGGSAKGGGPSLREVFRRKNFWVLLAVYLPMLALYGSSLQNLAPIVTSYGFSRQAAGVMVSAFSLAHVVSTLVMGMLSDRVGNRVPLFGLTVTSALGALIVAFGGAHMNTLTTGFVLIGISGGLWPLLAAAAALEFGANGVGRVFGLLTFFLPVVSLNPFILAKIQESTHSYAPGLTGAAILTLFGGFICLLLMRERRDAPIG
jgi:MFS family permease